MIIAGIDEAGYGPLLGPLVVSATAFEAPPGDAVAAARSAEGPWGVADALPLTVEDLPCLWRALRGAVARKAPATKGRILVADSKAVHNLADGDRLLERGVLAFAHAGKVCQGDVLTTTTLARALGCTDHELATHPWYAGDEAGLPVWASAGDISIASNMLQTAMRKAGVRVVAMRTTLVPERRYNALVAGTNNKASALVSLTLGHLYALHNAFGDKGLVVGIDKQGGRDHYTTLLLQSFPDAQLRVLGESDAGSSYLLMEGARRTVIHFRQKGETHFLPTALASMICKYLRELCMHTFNAWWCRQVPNLTPTAGYYQDGTRWLADVEPHLARLGVQREHLVRSR